MTTTENTPSEPTGTKPTEQDGDDVLYLNNYAYFTLDDMLFEVLLLDWTNSDGLPATEEDEETYALCLYSDGDCILRKIHLPIAILRRTKE